MKSQVSEWGIWVLLFLFLLPLFSLNVTGLHGWGGDFSQYIHQAINIVDNKDVADIGYIFNENNPSLAPSAYPVGFPLLLSPVYAFFGNNMIAFMLFISLVVFLLGLLCFYFIKIEFGMLAGLLATTLLIYNPWTIIFKSNVLSDIPFTLFFLLSAISYMFWKNKRSAILIGLIIGFTILIRTIGIVIPIAIAIDKLLNIISKNKSQSTNRQSIKNEIKELLTIILSSIAFVILMHKFIFPIPNENGYMDIISYATNFDYIGNHLFHYIELTISYFTLENASWLSVFHGALFGLFSLVGFFERNQKTMFMRLLVLGLFGVLMVYPFTQGFRFAYPIVPFLIYFFFNGVNRLISIPKYKKIFLAFYILLTLFLYVPKVIGFQMHTQANPLFSGPQVDVTKEAFQYIKEHVPEDARMVFSKPRVLSLYTDRACMGNSYLQADEMQRKFSEKNINYILINRWLAEPNTSLDLYVQKYKESHLDSIWSNSRYVLYGFSGKN